MTSAIIAGIPASTLVSEQKSYSHGNRGLICGVGVNDFPTAVRVNGVKLKSYVTWHNMLLRSYSPEYQARASTYVGCSVAQEWLLFSVFEKWYTENYVEGYQLDKDLLVQGNKVYSSDLCVFVEPALNTLLGRGTHQKSNLPLGVSLTKRGFTAKARSYYYRKYLGYFDTPLEAHRAWQLAKALIIENFPTNDPRIRKALDLRVAQLRDDHANNRTTTKL